MYGVCHHLRPCLYNLLGHERQATVHLPEAQMREAALFTVNPQCVCVPCSLPGVEHSLYVQPSVCEALALALSLAAPRHRQSSNLNSISQGAPPSLPAANKQHID